MNNYMNGCESIVIALREYAKAVTGIDDADLALAEIMKF